MEFAAVYHRPRSEFAHAVEEGRFVFRLRAAHGMLKGCALHCTDRAPLDPGVSFARLPMARVRHIAGALGDLQAAGFWAVGASEHAEGVCWETPLAGRIALVMGSEGDGISRLVLETCDDLTKLPQRGQTESLNVAQAATALCYEWLRQNSR